MKALVTAEWTDEGRARLTALGYDVQSAGWGTAKRALDREALVQAAAGAELLVIEAESVDADVLAQLPDLRVLGTARAEPGNVDLAACTARGIPVLHAPGRNAESVGDFVIGLMTTLVRGIGAAERHLRDEGWLIDDEPPEQHFRGPELSRLTLGLVGFGATGRAVARRAQGGFHMRVVFHDPQLEDSLPLEEVLATADVISLHCSTTPDTEGLIGAAQLAAMKPGAYLINTAGGRVVDEAALVEALSRGRIAGAALDVFAEEPLPAESLLRHLDNVVLTPHLAGAADVVRHHSRVLCDDIERFRRGQPPHHCANPEVLPPPLAG